MGGLLLRLQKTLHWLQSCTAYRPFPFNEWMFDCNHFVSSYSTKILFQTQLFSAGWKVMQSAVVHYSAWYLANNVTRQPTGLFSLFLYLIQWAALAKKEEERNTKKWFHEIHLTLTHSLSFCHHVVAVGDCHNTPALSACRRGTNAFKAVCFSSEKSLIIFYLNVICKVSSERGRLFILDCVIGFILHSFTLSAMGRMCLCENVSLVWLFKPPPVILSK